MCPREVRWCLWWIDVALIPNLANWYMVYTVKLKQGWGVSGGVSRQHCFLIHDRFALLASHAAPNRTSRDKAQ